MNTQKFDLINYLDEGQLSNQSCKLCRGRTPRPINACNCLQGFIHQQCLKHQISKQLKYKVRPQLRCNFCLKQYEYELIKTNRCRNSTEICEFVLENIVPQIAMCLLISFGLYLNQKCLTTIQATTFWMRALKIYLILVGIYLELLFFFILFMVGCGFKEEFMVRNYEPDNIIITRKYFL